MVRKPINLGALRADRSSRESTGHERANPLRGGDAKQGVSRSTETAPLPKEYQHVDSNLAEQGPAAGELLGALSIAKPAGDPLRPTEEKLANDLAFQAGLVPRNVRLTTELVERLRDLEASRKRIVAAQDAERRRIERNLHELPSSNSLLCRSSSPWPNAWPRMTAGSKRRWLF